ncbi:hypothetical protein SPRG_21598 [Saprolegnia parasitica CBS 223.65]|uniref:OPT family oligopeptide transporter n=1 Tax=Saprolegnia parasitica (strain CBS 223.65) TaxID=695850 RepID=A0A067BL97_SAPPC|nr:hypothetical protein SPRG_21598 [Saprolegnia parasitica CBS 223.65]KDO19214.1 hypothetical protein SPRG_21598 [Saprolegnia parasitica CBS 223.65]|eukprot:XP_012210080.1 hypothetical protein SPRG_21598 [Saprolegnia parasitica CBS 223.65]
MRSAQNSVVSEYKVAATPKWDENADDAVANEAKHAAEFEVITSGLEHPQVTIKSLVVGTIMGTFTSVLAMYYSLKLGVTPSLNVLSGIGGFMLCRALMKTQFFGKHFTVQENVVIQTCAVACMSLASQAGFGSGILGLTENVFLIMGNTTYAGNLASDVIDFTWLRSFGWCASIALFGFFISFPLRRKFIIEMRLLFPSGTATAVMIKTLHTSKEAVEYQWNVLLKSGVFAYVWSIFVFCFNGLGEFPIFGEKAAGFTRGNDNDVLSKAQRQAYLDKIFESAHIPTWSWVGGLVVFATVSVVVISLMFETVKWYKVLVCCLLIPIFAIGIVQGTGMTDWNVSSAVGKLILFVIGSWTDGNDKSIIASLILCQMVIVGCSQAADLMQDFKTGYLVGASAKSMIIAQIFGACMSCLVVPTVWVLMNDAYTLPGPLLKAPFGEVYRVMAITATVGLSGLPTYCGYFMLVGVVYTIVFNLYIDNFSESKNKVLNVIANHCPLPMAVSIGMIVPASFGLEGMIMAGIIAYWKSKDEDSFEKTQYILAAGLMTGEGFSVLTQIIVTLCGGSAPVQVSYAMTP